MTSIQLTFLAFLFSTVCLLTGTPARDREAAKTGREGGNFERVGAHLERGGILYGFVDIEGDLAELVAGAQGFLKEMQKDSDGLPFPPPSAIRNMVEATGLFEIDAVGVSSSEYGSLFHNRLFFLMPDGPHGLFRIGGTANERFQSRDRATSGTDLIFEREFHGEVLLDFLRAVAKEIGPAAGMDGVAELDGFLRQPIPTTTITPLAVIEALSGRAWLWVEIDENEKISLPGGAEVPGLNFLLRFERAASLFPEIADFLRQSGFNVVSAVDADGASVLTLRIEGTPFRELTMVANEETGEFLLASSAAHLDRIRTRSVPVSADPAFQQATHGLPDTGVSFLYLTPEWSEYMMTLLHSSLPQDESEQNARTTAFIVDWVAKDLRFSEPMAAVGSFEEEGLLIASNLNRSHKTTLLTAAYANPMSIGLLAAMAIPAFERVRENSQQTAILNNLRQLRAAADQYFLEYGTTRVEVAKLIGPDGFIRMLEPVAGETYPEIITRDEELTATLPDGTEVRLNND